MTDMEFNKNYDLWFDPPAQAACASCGRCGARYDTDDMFELKRRDVWLCESCAADILSEAKDALKRGYLGEAGDE